MARTLPLRVRTRPELEEARVLGAFARLYKEKALHTLVRGALAPALLKRLLRPEFSRRTASEIPDEAWASLAAKLALDSAAVGMPLAEALSDRLGWDREPSSAEDWLRLAEERPLEALWLGALSEDKSVRKSFPRLAAAASRAFRASPSCPAPSWAFVDMVLELQASYVKTIDLLEREREDQERRLEAERQRSEDLRDELKRLRRENAEQRAERAVAEKRAAAAMEARLAIARTPESARLEEAERRVRKAEKEVEHLRRELDRRREAAPASRPSSNERPAVAPGSSGPTTVGRDESNPAIAAEANPRRRVLRQILKKLFKKGKIGASHTHEDNVYRGVADHEKGLAKEAIEILYREGLLMPKPTTTDPHVSLRPERTGEIQAIIAGEIDNPRLTRFVEGNE